MASGPNIFEYLSFRDYLGDFYAQSKARNPAFSYRYFAMRAGYRSPVTLKLVIEGHRNLSARGIEGFARALRLKGHELSYFRDLVAFGQADGPDARNAALERLRSRAAFNATRALRGAQYDYLSHWYMPAIREMVLLRGFVENAARIAQRLRRRVPTSVARKAVATLLDLGLLTRGAGGELRHGDGHADDIVSPGHEVRRLSLVNFHRQLLECADRALVEVDRSRRHFNALTFAVPESQIAALKARINAFVEEVATLAASGGAPDAVYQLHVTHYPHTVPDGRAR